MLQELLIVISPRGIPHQFKAVLPAARREPERRLLAQMLGMVCLHQPLQRGIRKRRVVQSDRYQRLITLFAVALALLSKGGEERDALLGPDASEPIDRKAAGIQPALHAERTNLSDVAALHPHQHEEFR